MSDHFNGIVRWKGGFEARCSCGWKARAPDYTSAALEIEMHANPRRTNTTDKRLRR